MEEWLVRESGIDILDQIQIRAMNWEVILQKVAAHQKKLKKKGTEFKLMSFVN
jgi:hypothetical protein